jgi:hypothetical protein
VNLRLHAKVIQLGGDPNDPVWEWFLLRGPHGATFSWSQTRAAPPGYVGIEHLRRIVAEIASDDPSFPARARQVAQTALASDDPIFVRRGLQVLAVVGGPDDRTRIQSLVEHRVEAIAKDARACLFELQQA